ncbi:MAG: hypothetical protein IKC32_05610 [Clostridia bacterium]|nr:hypothetical protein [Clostridia bacterium]
MYTRSYDEEERISLPEGYSGTMMEPEHIAAPPPEEEEEKKGNDAAPVSGFLGSLFSSGIGAFKGLPLLKNMKFGIEELLIGGTALFLLFSKEGDKECALMLLLLLFIS